MSLPTLYVAGPMTGKPDFNYPEFNETAEFLRALGYPVENPAENTRPTTDAWIDFMRDAIVQLSRCDGVAVLPGWESSRGARLEVKIARGLGLPVRTVNEWVALASPPCQDTSHAGTGVI